MEPLKQDEDHLVVFNDFKIPLTGEKQSFRIHGGGDRRGYATVTAQELHDATLEALMPNESYTEKYPKLGSAKSNFQANHCWNGSQKVMEGSGMINPPRPAGWFGLADMEARQANITALSRQEKDEMKARKRRSNMEETDQDGQIIDLQEFMAARAEEEAANNERVDVEDDDFWDEPEIEDENSFTGAAGEDVPDCWDDEP